MILWPLRFDLVLHICWKMAFYLKLLLIPGRNIHFKTDLTSLNLRNTVMCSFQGETGNLCFPTFPESTWTNLWRYLLPAKWALAKNRLIIGVKAFKVEALKQGSEDETKSCDF